VTPLEMAYAYSTIANEGVRVSGTLAPNQTGPVAFEEVDSDRRGIAATNEVVRKRVFPASVGATAKEMLHLVVTSGTGKSAQVGDEYLWGKTGTTENYGDAWFAGGNEDISVAIWVGYADRLQPMEYEHAGGPVAGGTFPAEIFHDFMGMWLEMKAERDAARAARKGDDEEDDGTTLPAVPSAPTEVVPTEPSAPVETAPETPAPDQGTGGEEAPAAPAPEAPPPAPAPTPTTPPATPPTTPPPTSGGTGGGTGAVPGASP
jgi:penicillin-binding protein 1A